jgi:uncharacterized membrane protein (DUF4010 family)
MLSETFTDLAIALALGLLVGLQKERAASPLAGLRTFALVSLAGGVSALVATATSPWVLVAGLLSVTGLMITGNIVLLHGEESDPGQTTEVAVVVTFLVGALTVLGPTEIGVVCGATTAVLLHLRDELHHWVGKLTDRDARAIMQFVVISLVVLPLVPDRAVGPYQVVNPRQVWWMVVLIVGLNLAGYGAFRLFGARAGTVLAGVLGGVISSTATTAGYARQTRARQGMDASAVVVVWIASGVVFVRVMLEVGAVAPSFLPVVVGPLAVLLGLFLVLALFAWRSGATPGGIPIEPDNPTELRPALLFGAIYAAVLLVVAGAQDLLGDAGLFGAAAVSGLTDVDALTLSTSRLVATDRLSPDTGWRLVVVGILANLAFKLILAATLGSRSFARRLGVLGGVAIAAGLALLLLWP